MRPKYNLLKHRFNNPFYDFLVIGNLPNASNEDIRYFTQRLVESLRLPPNYIYNYDSYE